MNKIISLLSRGNNLPEGWGFPPLSEPSGRPSQLRDRLMFLSGTEGVCQLVRWYYGLILSCAPVWRSLAEEEGYDASFFHKPCIESPSLSFVRSPGSGALLLGWVPGPGDVLEGTLRIEGESGVLSLDDDYMMAFTLHPDSGVWDAVWPGFLNLDAGLAGLPEGTHTIRFRPSSFNALKLAADIEEHCGSELHAANMLAAFMALPRAEDKLAVAWLAVAILDEA